MINFTSVFITDWYLWKKGRIQRQQVIVTCDFSHKYWEDCGKIICPDVVRKNDHLQVYMPGIKPLSSVVNIWAPLLRLHPWTDCTECVVSSSRGVMLQINKQGAACAEFTNTPVWMIKITNRKCQTWNQGKRLLKLCWVYEIAFVISMSMKVAEELFGLVVVAYNIMYSSSALFCTLCKHIYLYVHKSETVRFNDFPAACCLWFTWMWGIKLKVYSHY